MTMTTKERVMRFKGWQKSRNPFQIFQIWRENTKRMNQPTEESFLIFISELQGPGIKRSTLRPMVDATTLALCMKYITGSHVSDDVVQALKNFEITTQ